MNTECKNCHYDMFYTTYMLKNPFMPIICITCLAKPYVVPQFLWEMIQVHRVVRKVFIFHYI